MCVCQCGRARVRVCNDRRQIRELLPFSIISKGFAALSTTRTSEAPRLELMAIRMLQNRPLALPVCSAFVFAQMFAQLLL